MSQRLRLNRTKIDGVLVFHLELFYFLLQWKCSHNYSYLEHCHCMSAHLKFVWNTKKQRVKMKTVKLYAAPILILDWDLLLSKRLGKVVPFLDNKTKDGIQYNYRSAIRIPILYNLYTKFVSCDVFFVIALLVYFIRLFLVKYFVSYHFGGKYFV